MFGQFKLLWRMVMGTRTAARERLAHQCYLIGYVNKSTRTQNVCCHVHIYLHSVRQIWYLLSYHSPHHYSTRHRNSHILLAQIHLSPYLTALLFLIFFISILNIYYLLRKFITTRPQGLKNVILQNPSMTYWWIWHIWFCYMCLFPDYNLVAASSNMLSQRIIAWWHVGDTNICIVGKFTFTATSCLE